MERVSGIEPPYPPWQGGVLPLNYTRKMAVPTRIELAISSVTGRHVSHYTTEPYFSKNEEFKSCAIKKLYPYSPIYLMERVSGIEPPYPPWQGGVLPLNYTRKMAVPTRIELAISSVTGRHVSHYTTEPFFWRRRRDLNPRAGFPTYALSRGTSSAS